MWINKEKQTQTNRHIERKKDIVDTVYLYIHRQIDRKKKTEKHKVKRYKKYKETKENRSIDRRDRLMVLCGATGASAAQPPGAYARIEDWETGETKTLLGKVKGQSVHITHRIGQLRDLYYTAA